MIKSYIRGHEVYFNGDDWFYVDNDEYANYDRLCKKCSNQPTKEGYDHCLGYIDGVSHACCGHGVEESYAVFKDVKSFEECTIKFDRIIIFFYA